jgi:CMP-N,N'-diacetyllegionaminic acid synthase
LRVLGVIPARGGSKRIPRKNCRLLHNVPLIGYTIRAAQSAVGLTDFVVSTEDEEIKNIAHSYGATVVDRPASLAGDDVTSGDVLRHALDVMEAGGERYDVVVCLHPTSPIRDPKDIDKSVKGLWASPYNTLASVFMLPRKAHKNVLVADGLYGGTSWGDQTAVMNASIYAMKRDWFVNHNKHVDEDGPILPYPMDRRHSVDIDTEIDFKIAELFLRDGRQ